MKRITNRTTLKPDYKYPISVILFSEFLAIIHPLFKITRDRGEWHFLKVINKFLKGDIFIEREHFHLKIRGDDPYWLRLLIRNYQYEPEIRSILYKLNLVNSVFIDVGANIGYWSHFVAANFQSTKLVLVEPNPHLFSECVESLKSNGFRSESINMALSNHSGLNVPLYCGKRQGDHAGASLILSTQGLQDSEIMVTTVCLDEIIGKYLNAGFKTVVKLDIEGMEEEVLASTNFLGNKNLFVIYEDHGKDLDSSASRFMLESIECTLWFLHKTKGPIKIQSLDHLAKMKTSRKVGYNILAASKELDLHLV